MSETTQTGRLEVMRRTFEAARRPKGSEERARLNCDPLTSEYKPSYRYRTSDGRNFRTKRDAEFYVELAEKYGKNSSEEERR